MNPLSHNASTHFHSNINLLRVMIEYLTCKDIVSLSQVSKFYLKATRYFDHFFKDASHDFFCSQYENYSIDNQWNESEIISSSNSTKEEKENSDVFQFKPISPSPSLYTWKEFFNKGMIIKQSWLSNPLQTMFVGDLTEVSDFLYKNLKECEVLPRLRKQNHIIEGDFNSPLQAFLNDFIYEQQDLYEEYNCIMMGYNNKEIKSRRSELPFGDLICKFKQLKESINTTKELLKLKQVRWYMFLLDNTPKDVKDTNDCFCKQINSSKSWVKKGGNSLDIFSIDETSEELLNESLDKKEETDYDLIQDNDLIDFNKIMNLDKEENPLFFVINCILLTITFYCEYSMNYIFYSYQKDSDIVCEYIKRYKNYIDTAIAVNEHCENINVAINYCYEELCDDSPSLPKFSLFRMFILTWNREVKKRINNDTTMLDSVKASLLSIYTNSMNELSEVMKNKTKVDKPTQLKDSSNFMFDNMSLTTSISTKNSSIMTNDSYNRFSASSMEDNISEFELKNEDSFENSLLEQGLSLLADSFCDEYSVFSLNHSNIEVNTSFQQTENKMIEIVENMLTTTYVQNERSQKDYIEDIIRYFSSSLYSTRIITQLKLCIYQTVQRVLKPKLTEDLIIDFKSYIFDQKLLSTKVYFANTFFTLNPNTLKQDPIYQEIICSSILQNQPEIIKEYCTIKYFKAKVQMNTSVLMAIKTLNDWIQEEQTKTYYKNKQIEKEIARKNIPQDFDKYQRDLLSLDNFPRIHSIQKLKEIMKLKKSKGNDLKQKHITLNEDLAVTLELL